MGMDAAGHSDPTRSALPETAVEKKTEGWACTALGERPGDSIGPYRLLEMIGEGGFGTVWLAERREPMVQRVALKIIKAGMDTKAVIARFEAERQALAMMNHPNIAKVFDAGATRLTPASGGRPYFVMEHVKGAPLTEYCDRHRLTIEQRLRLFILVCDAVQHAHMRGIIHRDLKPSNILVSIAESGEARPVVIDFGVAKALAGRLTDATIFTERGQVIGTPEYMSPEQAEMSETEIDTRSDVYSLGVVLYELLVGAVPFDLRALRAAGLAAVQKLIRESDPPRPSTRLSSMGEFGTSVVAARQTRLADLASELRQELEWIPLKALRKDRAERYRAASELGDDVANYLAHRPLIAGPERTAYRVRKFVRRNKGAAAAAGAISFSLFLATALSTWFGLREFAARRSEFEQRVEAVRQRGIAEKSAEEAVTQQKLAEASASAEGLARARAESVNMFLKEVLRSSDPEMGGKQLCTIVDAMDNAVRRLDSGAFKVNAETEADLRETIATILQNNGRIAEAEPLFERALAIRRRQVGGDQLELANSMSRLACARQMLGRISEAESLYRESLSMRRRLSDDDQLSVVINLVNLALVCQEAGDASAAARYTREASEMRLRLHQRAGRDASRDSSVVQPESHGSGNAPESNAPRAAAFETYQGQLYESGESRTGRRIDSVFGASEDTLFLTEHLSSIVQSQVAIFRTVHDDHPAVSSALSNLSFIWCAVGCAEEAECLAIEALGMDRRLYAGDHQSIAISLQALARSEQVLGKIDMAGKHYREAVEMNRRLFHGDHPVIASSLRRLAGAVRESHDPVEAESLGVQALEMDRRLYPRDHMEVAASLVELSQSRLGLGDRTEGLQGLHEAEAMLRRLEPFGSMLLARVLEQLGELDLERRDSAAALPRLEEAVTIAVRFLPADAAELTGYRRALTRCREAIGE